MALTDEEIQQALDAVMARTLDIRRLETVETLDGVNSLPAVKGAVPVSVPVSLLYQNAVSAPLFSGRVSGVSVTVASIGSPDAVVYDDVKKTFLALSVPSGTIGSPVYYINWGENRDAGIPEADVYGEYTAQGRTPVRDRIYVDTAENILCRWNGAELVRVNGFSPDDIPVVSEADIDAMWD